MRRCASGSSGKGYGQRARWCRRPRGFSNGPIWPSPRSQRRCRPGAPGAPIDPGGLDTPHTRGWEPTWPTTVGPQRPSGTPRVPRVHKEVRHGLRAPLAPPKPILLWLAGAEKRSRGRSARAHQELLGALPSAPGHISHRLRLVEPRGFMVVSRTLGGQAESLSLPAAGRQQVAQLVESSV